MRRRRWLLATLVALAAAVGLFFLWRPASVEERARRVREGMTRAEVLEVVGEPPGLYARATSWADSGLGPGHLYAGWYWDEGVLRVWFTEDGRVQRASFKANPDPPSFLTLWRLRLGL
jgi:hypothetical protein